MTRRGLVLGFALVSLVATGVLVGEGLSGASVRRPHLSATAASRDELLERFLTALEQRDVKALNATRVTYLEYRDVVIPGTVEPDQPPAMLKVDERALFANIVELKSRLYATTLVDRYGGRRWKVEKLTFEKGTHDYLWFRGHRRLVLELVDPEGHRAEVRTGSVIEENGRFKFASFIAD